MRSPNRVQSPMPVQPVQSAVPGRSAAGRRAGRSVLGLALAGLTAVLLTGCSAEEASCGGGEYPVLAVGSTGSACVPDGEEPPAGYARYPEGKVPEHVGDEWDEYWSTRTLDENGNIIKAPEAG